MANIVETIIIDSDNELEDSSDMEICTDDILPKTNLT